MKIRPLLAVLLVLGLSVAGCDRGGVTQYTIEQFLDTETIFGGSFSFDEERLLISTDRTGIFNAYYIPVGGGDPVQLTASSDNAVIVLSYFPHDDRILFLSDKGGNEIYHIYLRDEEGVVNDLTPAEKARSVFYGWTFDRENFLYCSNKRDEKYMDVYIMDIETLTSKMIYLNDPGYSFGWISNDLRYMSFTKTITEHNSDIYLYDRRTGEVKHITPHRGDINYRPEDFSPDSKYLYYLTDEGRDFTYLKSYEIETGKTETVEQADWDITYSKLSRTGRYRVTGINVDGKTEIKIHDAKSGDPVGLPRLPDGVITSVGISDSERLMKFYVNGSRSPNNLYVLNLETGKYLKLTDSMNPEIDRDDLVEAEVIRYKSFDGEVIPSIYYRPRGIKPGKNIPALVLVHGGPGGQSRVGYRETVQYLVNHGYAVLAVNNRGSSGYGKRFYKLDDMKHGEDDLRDCIEGKNWLIHTGYVDPERIGIIGASYGGYMVLAALTLTPEEFALGVDLFGISNWVRTLESIPPWWEHFREALYQEMGNPETDKEYLTRISPLFHADKIVRPLMVLQGANDPRVLKIESDEIVEAARKNGVDVDYIVFDDEGHGFMKKANRISGYKAILGFLDKHLKKGSS
ncbi:MAG: S9 family peptidase [Candidatus Krumholzibacteriota bacterium]|nr:S9 family peptidase [Candidatus Krumholzibacteriota bacterium]